MQVSSAEPPTAWQMAGHANALSFGHQAYSAHYPFQHVCSDLGQPITTRPEHPVRVAVAGALAALRAAKKGRSGQQPPIGNEKAASSNEVAITNGKPSDSEHAVPDAACWPGKRIPHDAHQGHAASGHARFRNTGPSLPCSIRLDAGGELENRRIKCN